MDPEEIIQTSPTTPVTHVEPVEPVKPVNNWGVSFLMLLVGILLGAGGLWGYQRLSARQVTPTQSPTASQAPNGDLASWKTFTNTKYNYSFKYPVNFSVSTEGNTNPVTANGIFIADDCNYNLGQRCLQGFIDTATPFNKDNKLSNYFVYAPGQAPTLLSEKQITIDNEPALAREIYDNNHYYSSTEKGMVDYDIYVVHSGIVYAFTFREEGKDQAKIKSIQDWQKGVIVDQILSTFKFIQ